MFPNSAIKSNFPVNVMDFMKKSDFLQDENESRFKKFRDLDRHIDRASSQLDSMTSELNSRKRMMFDDDDESNAMNLFWPPFNKPYESHRFDTYDSFKEAKGSGDKIQEEKNSMSSILSPTIDLTELYKARPETSHEIDCGYWDESDKPSTPLTSSRSHFSSQKQKIETEIPSSARNVKDFLSSSTSKPAPCDNDLVAGTSKNDVTQLDKKKSAVKQEQVLQTLSQTIEKSKLKKKKLSHLGKKYALSRKRSGTSRITDTSEIVKRKKKKLKNVSSLCTVATRDVNFDDKDRAEDKGALKSKKIKSDKYIYPDLSYQTRKETAGKNVAVKDKNVEVNQVNLKNNETMTIVQDKTIQQKNVTEKQVETSSKPVAKTVKNAETVTNVKIDKPTVPLKKNVEPESTPKKVQKDDEHNEVKKTGKETKEKKEVKKEKAQKDDDPNGVKKAGKETKDTIEVKKEKEKAKEIIELKCPRIDEENEYDKFGDMDEKNLNAVYQEFMATRRYENPTTASKLKQADMTYYRRYHIKSIPFIASTSLSPSHNIGLCVQEMLGLMKNRQVLINGSTRMLIRKVSKGVEPITSLWPEMHGKTDVEPQNNDSNANQSQNPVWTSFTPNDDMVSNSGFKNKVAQCENIKMPEKLNVTSDATQDLLQDHPDPDFKIQKKNLMEVKHVFSILYDQFNRLNTKYENLLSQSEKSDNSNIRQEIAKLEKELVGKEEEINVFIYLYQELMTLRQQVKDLTYRNSLVCLSSPDSYAKMSSKLNPIQRYRDKSQCSIGSTNVQLATKLKTFLSSHKRIG